MFSSPRPTLPPRSVSLPPSDELWWRKALGLPRHSFGFHFHEICPFLQVYAVWGSLLSWYSFRISSFTYIFIKYVLSGGGLYVTSHTIFNTWEAIPQG